MPIPQSLVMSGFDPALGMTPEGRWWRALWRVREETRARLGVRRSFRVGNFYYKETSTVPLWRSLSPQGGGVKEYRITYADGSKQYIHCTPDRVYADAMGAVLLPEFHRVASMIRPGQRVVCLPGGTGYCPAWLGEQVGSSGAVVSIEADKESVLYAQKRYAGANIAHETGTFASLRGETDGSFDAAISISHVPQESDAQVLRELWRVIAPGGWMLVGRTLLSPAELRRMIGQALRSQVTAIETDDALTTQAG
ncbi:MAG: methyltransferase domain-containing protein, partial [Pyrinomonadaceae bacterium]|nr:methyltransferase domain-containing protein [Phycisphaerales bacterium]